MSSPTIKRNLNWLREARDAGPRVIACLSAAGFDISEDELLVLGATATKGDAAGDVTRAFGFTRERDNQVASALLARGYLESQDGPDDRGRPSVAVSGRGRSLLRVTLDAALAARWNSFPFRQGDIVISTPYKCGTTWMQMICALLIFQTPELPAPLPELSPWLEMRQNDRDEMFARLAAQRHRRFIKTHLPLSEICVDGRATYIVMARHPLDAAASMYRLAEHTDRSGSGHEASRLHESLLRWLDQGPSLPEDRDSLPGRLRHLADAWVRRAEPNVMLVHYEDLAADLGSGCPRRPGRVWSRRRPSSRCGPQRVTFSRGATTSTATRRRSSGGVCPGRAGRCSPVPSWPATTLGRRNWHPPTCSPGCTATPGPASRRIILPLILPPPGYHVQLRCRSA
jgi:aryl sulfotransferase